MNGYEINKNEIWEVECSSGAIKYFVILSCFEKYAAAIMLQEREPENNAVVIRVRDVMYADAGRLGYIFYDKAVDFVRALSEDESRELRQAIGEALDLEINKASAATNAMELEARDKAYNTAKLCESAAAEATVNLEAAEKRADYWEAEAAALRKKLEAATPEAGAGYIEELAAARKEAEIYKGLYETMLARALG